MQPQDYINLGSIISYRAPFADKYEKIVGMNSDFVYLKQCNANGALIENKIIEREINTLKSQLKSKAIIMHKVNGFPIGGYIPQEIINPKDWISKPKSGDAIANGYEKIANTILDKKQKNERIIQIKKQFAEDVAALERAKKALATAADVAIWDILNE